MENVVVVVGVGMEGVFLLWVLFRGVLGVLRESCRVLLFFNTERGLKQRTFFFVHSIVVLFTFLIHDIYLKKIYIL